MTEQQYSADHNEFMKRINALDRQYAADAKESPEEEAWLENRMNEVKSKILINNTDNESNSSIQS